MRVLSSSEADLGGVQYADLKKATQTQVHIHSRVQICCALSSTRHVNFTHREHMTLVELLLEADLKNWLQY
jgi:hypothetical protein